MTVSIFGVEYPLKYTIAAENAIAERAGGLENLNAAMEREGAAGRMDIMASMLAALIAGGVARAKLDARLAGDEYTGPEAVPIEDIQALTVAELTDLSGAIMAAIKEGSAVTVELQPQKKKNAATVKVTTEWLKATGLALGFALGEVLCCTPGEIISLANADAIRHGAKQKRTIKTFDEFLALE